jgi:glycosyltransferase involved in cell wall biosynthesis
MRPKSRIKLLVINQYFHPDVAATGQLLTELCLDLSEHHEVTVITGFPTYDPLEKRKVRLFADERLERVRIVRVFTAGLSRKNMAARMLNYVTFLVSALIAGLLVGRHDVILAMTDPPLVGLVARLITLFKRAPLVIVCQDVYPEVAVVLGKMKNAVVTKLLDLAVGWPLGRAARVVAISQGMKQRLIAKGIPSEKITVIENWVDTNLVVPCERSENEFAERLGLDGQFVVLHSGNIGLTQDLETFVECARLLRERQDIRFLIIGDGANRRRLEAMVAEYGLHNVVFLPYQPRQNLKYSLSCGDIAVVSLKAGLEGYVEPSKVYSIMASGRPFVAAVGVQSEVARVAREHGCGRVIPPGEPEALANAVLLFYENRGVGKRSGSRGRQAAIKLFDRKIAVGKYRKMLEAVKYGDCRLEIRPLAGCSHRDLVA